MGDYHTIKELVIESCVAEGKFPSYEKLTSLSLGQLFKPRPVMEALVRQ